MKKIFLIGFMGCGKSTAGKKLAAKLKMDFIDMDDTIEAEQGKIISEIFSKEGEDEFRKIENSFLKKVSSKDNLVISTGGGTPCFFNNMELMNANGISVYFKMSVDSLVNRLMNAKKKRPLIQDMNEIDLRHFVYTNMEKREPFYGMAHYKVKAKNLDIDELTVFLEKEIYSR